MHQKPTFKLVTFQNFNLTNSNILLGTLHSESIFAYYDYTCS